MKKIFVMILLMGTSVSLVAQNTRVITGGVVDKYGNPLPGAKVEATAGAESTITDADGSFSIEVSRWLKSLTATYPGMKTKEKNLRSDNNEVVFTMLKEGKGWFVNTLYQYDANHKTGAFGLMGGQLGEWGWYGKFMMELINLPESLKVEADPNPMISIGVIKGISSQFYSYFGLGYSKCFFKEWPLGYSDDSLLLDLGFMYNANRVNFNLGFSYRRIFKDFFSREGTDDGKGIHVGIGYAF